ncbi:hypothetical protein CHLNCDRAFT_141545 [Chlorella variabilis]|uniref:Uncharacterized protein n=1 Tax=Chlorella variabilis TaxID=554065 RepID=E1ZT32_CHLVA|nr:hypothetical protein CHLNCDRAFT_141545 [Chlorella variabilis]EFN51042.1 hypothetical protein CHLNCDRAFT_141545 [Chlorella variabilis]|eukprot:XP_005843144.1 hypothetical protein CHLNCDRAFT_141545 [Chlorella variabilis]
MKKGSVGEQDLACALSESQGQTPSELADERRVRYGVTDVPPWWMCILLGFQTYLTMLGATVLIPILLVPAMGGDTEDLAKTICTCFFASGINTLLQTLLGARLPIGGSFAYISPVFALAASIQGSMTFDSDHDRFIYTMRELQGGIIGSALIALGLALFGIFLWMLQHLSPITIGVNISILGLSLYSAGWPLGLPVMCLIIFFAFHLRRVKIFGLAVFGLFPVILGLGLTWLYAYIATVAGAYDNASPETQQACTTWQSNSDYILSVAPWFRVPYPGQWGSPIFTATSVLTMIAAVIPAALESIGDYYAAARLGGAPQPPRDVISRALMVESLCCTISGLFGTTSGSTAYAENVGSIAITGVASRRVTQTGAVVMIILGTIGKFGALFASIPQAMVAGMFTVMFSLIAGVGFSNLEGVDLHSERNIFILGFGLYSGAPRLLSAAALPPPAQRDTFNSILNSLFSTPAAVALMACLLLDLTIPKGRRERTQEAWQRQGPAGDWWEDETKERIYGWPFHLTPKWRRFIDPYKNRAYGALVKCCETLTCSGARKRLVLKMKPGGAASPADTALPLAQLSPSGV